ncbi:STAS domain-containing protein [Fodinicola acaciae]|uniref:STAS domain-containing protein n=1 Tax=Fodinicola acaciae TaxID=2681555 RepID=UPI0013D2379D|nr:STAS domain-containing protein [Fodinicola acaciae]
MTDPAYPPGAGLSVDVSESAGVTVVTVAGELDMATEPEFSRQVEARIDAAPRAVVLDLSGLGFVGSAGLKALVEQQQHAELRQVSLRLVLGGSPIERLLELTGLEATFAVYGTLDEARGAS